MNDLAIHFARRSVVHDNIAADIWPHGAILSCKECGYSQRVTTEAAASYLRAGWPIHCGATMTCESAPPASGVSRHG